MTFLNAFYYFFSDIKIFCIFLILVSLTILLNRIIFNCRCTFRELLKHLILQCLSQLNLNGNDKYFEYSKRFHNTLNKSSISYYKIPSDQQGMNIIIFYICMVNPENTNLVLKKIAMHLIQSISDLTLFVTQKSFLLEGIIFLLFYLHKSALCSICQLMRNQSM